MQKKVTSPSSSGCPEKGQPSQDETAAGCPTPQEGALTYNGYLMVNELKNLQVCQSDPAHHDEPLFIIIHQAYELWFKLILHEIDAVLQHLAAREVRKATLYIRRIVVIFKLLVQQIHVLETMAPKDFLGFRYSLTPASGFQSSQFREIEFAAGLKNEQFLQHFAKDPAALTILQKRYDDPSLLEAFYELLRKKGFTLPTETASMSESECQEAQERRIKSLVKLYDEEDKYGDLHDLAEAFMDFDEQIFLWRAHHVTVVERMIGFKRGTGGSDGVGYLRTTLEKRCFGDLWRLRTYLEQPEGTAGAVSSSGCPFNQA